MSLRSTRTHGLRLCCAAVLLSCAIPVFAQFDAASVLGFVRDASGAAVANATVTLTNVETGVTQTVKTDKDGKYEFASVKIGDYKVQTEASGFSRYESATFPLTVNARQRVDADLKVGSSNEVVEVNSLPTQLETETSSRGQVIGTREVENLPLNGRSYADLALLAPGTRRSALETGAPDSREASFNVDGQRSAFNNFLLDGLDNNNYGTSNQGFANENIPPSPDAVDEFRVETNNYSAEYGRNPGAVINVSTRRGTNAFHGKAYDYNRNTALNANNYFSTPGTHLKYIRNQFGGTFGGPIFKDKAFFFTDYEGNRTIFNQALTVSTLPTANQRAGLFYVNDDPSNPANAIPLRNPITGRTYLGVVPQADMTTFAKNVLAALPANNVAGLANNYNTTPRGTINDDKGDGRIDYTLSPRYSLFGRYSEHRATIFTPPGIPGPAGGNANGNVHILNRDIAGGATITLSATRLLDLRFGWSHNEGGKTPIGVGQASILTQSGITDGLPTDPTIVRSLNGQAITGFSQFGAQTSNPQFQNPTIFNPKANYTTIRGRHALKLGFEFQQVNTQINDFNPSYGQDNYAGLYSTAINPAVANTPACQAANALSVANCTNPTNTTPAGSAPSLSSQLQEARNLTDFLFGNRSGYSLTTFAIVNVRQRYNFMYVQDDIKVSPSLTLNVGLRYEIVTPQYERDNKLANYDPTTSTLIQAKNGSIADRAQVNINYTNFAPRFGFAKTLDAKTVVRGGYGIVYSQWNRAGGENNLTYNGPNVVNANIASQVTPSPSTLCQNDTQVQANCFRQTQQGYAAGLVSPANFNPLNVLSRYIPRHNPTGYVQNYFVGFQRDLGHGWLVDLSYVGNKSTHLQVLGDYNQATPCLLSSGCPNVQARRPITNFQEIEIAANEGSANYNSLQMRTEKRLGSGLFLLNSFTYSRVFDISSGHLETANGDNSRVNIRNTSQDYGPGGYDQPLNDTLSMVYDLPYGHGRHFGSNSNGAVNAVLGGWQVTLVNQVTSGLPININYSLATSSGLFVSDLVTYRPNRVAGQPIFAPAINRKRTATGGTITGYFNNAAFALPTTYPWGNLSRNVVRSTPFYQADLGVHKQFPVFSERVHLDFRAEAFNVLNKVNLQAPNSTYGSSSFGAVTSAYPARQLQLAGKLIF
ncbi:TonB-dependent receptor [Terriglobus aquaticus]|uniref:Carboxypeptidase regulatory-like domain-containing protein n=1 Tax=Terriglobus aquaticus TaxID=940139 RepID=A0ABW9KP06_9BACT|nr:carboxypeptidase regulatory-like domain-containing protein [Terriglobus aquaticus]